MWSAVPSWAAAVLWCLFCLLSLLPSFAVAVCFVCHHWITLFVFGSSWPSLCCAWLSCVVFFFVCCASFRHRVGLRLLLLLLICVGVFTSAWGRFRDCCFDLSSCLCLSVGLLFSAAVFLVLFFFAGCCRLSGDSRGRVGALSGMCALMAVSVRCAVTGSCVVDSPAAADVVEWVEEEAVVAEPWVAAGLGAPEPVPEVAGSVGGAPVDPWVVWLSGQDPWT